MAEARKSDGSTADVSSPPQKKVRNGDDQNESLAGHPIVRDHPISGQKGRRVDLSDDRVTFTVQDEIAVESKKRTAAFSRCESQPSASDGAQDLWLVAFNRYLKEYSSQCCTDSGSRAHSKAVQAFYHSSVFPIPTMRTMGDVSNGLICACLCAFTEVIHALQSFARRRKALAAAQTPDSPPRRYISSSARRSRYFCFSKRRSIPQCIRRS